MTKANKLRDLPKIDSSDFGFLNLMIERINFLAAKPENDFTEDDKFAAKVLYEEFNKEPNVAKTYPVLETLKKYCA